jgi:protein-tyrosine phosphatase
VQVTAHSLLGEFGRRAAEFSRTLLDRQLVHFLASDAHDCERRTPRLDLAYAWVKEKYGEERAEALCVLNPRATLTGEALEPVKLVNTTEQRKWYQLWR